MFARTKRILSSALSSPWAKLYLASGILTAAACGGMGEGDYEVYRVAFDQTAVNANCYADDVPLSMAEDRSDVLNAATMMFFIDAEGTPRLDTGSIILVGQDRGDDRYEFEGEILDVEYQGATADTAKYTTLEKIEIVFDRDGGKTITGEVSNRVELDCSGSGCPPRYEGLCTKSTDFTGIRVDEEVFTVNGESVPRGQTPVATFDDNIGTLPGTGTGTATSTDTTTTGGLSSEWDSTCTLYQSCFGADADCEALFTPFVDDFTCSNCLQSASSCDALSSCYSFDCIPE
ncbi:MAG: hypothetical protein AAGA56_28500 [Myxococcota bacterium]